MLKLQIINSKELKVLLIKLQKQFGVEDTSFLKEYMFIKNQKKKIFISTKVDKIPKFKIPRLEKVGLYFATINKDDSLRLSLEGSQIIGKCATHNIFELDHSQAENWLKGLDFDIPELDDGYHLLKYKDDFLGCGLIRLNKLYNFLPKNRRLRVLYD